MSPTGFVRVPVPAVSRGERTAKEGEKERSAPRGARDGGWATRTPTSCIRFRAKCLRESPGRSLLGRLVVRPRGRASSSLVRVVQRAEVALELRARDVQRGVGVQALEHLLEQVARVVLLAHHGAQVQQTAHLGIAAERLRAVSGGFRGAEGTEVSRDVFECARREAARGGVGGVDARVASTRVSEGGAA